MNKKTLVALLVFAALLGVVLFLQSRPERGVRVGERPRPMAKLDAKKIDLVAITTKGKTVELKRDGADKWKVTKPVAYAADKHSADTVVEKLASMEFGDLVTEQKTRHGEYDLTGDAAIHVVASSGGKPVADIYLGKVLEDFTMFRLASKDDVWQVVGALRHAFDREVTNWRDRTILSFKQEDARKLQVTTAAGTIKLSRKDDKAAWKVDESPLEIGRLDSAVATNILSSLYSLSAHQFADDVTPQKAGVDRPTATVTVELKDGEKHTVQVGDKKDEDTYLVQRPGANQIFVLQKHTTDNLVRRPIDFRDKTVLSFKPADVVALELNNVKEGKAVRLVYKASGWSGNGKKVEDTTKIKAAVDALSSLSGEGFAWHTAKELGLDKPDWVIKVELKDKTRHELKVGSVEKDSMVGLSRKGSADIFTARKYALERFLLDPANYK